MSFSIGIGIITYNRNAILSETIDRVRAYTRQPGAALVVAIPDQGGRVSVAAAAGQVLTAAQALTGQSGHLKDVVQQFLAGVKAA